MQPLPQSVIAPAWAVLPVAGLVVLWALWYAWRIHARPGMAPVRRRIRTANAVVMVALAGALSYGLCGVSSAASPRVFVTIWTAAALLTLVMACLALLDSWYTARLSLRAAGQLRRELRGGRAERDEGAG